MPVNAGSQKYSNLSTKLLSAEKSHAVIILACMYIYVLLCSCSIIIDKQNKHS